MQINAKLEEMKQEHDEGDNETDFKIPEAKQIDPRMRYLKVDISMDEHTDVSIQKFEGKGPTHSGVDTIYHI